MKLGISSILPIVVLIMAGSGICQENEAGKKPDILAGTIEGLSVDNILTSQLELVEGVEVVVSHIVIPPHTELPKHWHHGEEFAYLIDGSVILWQEGKEEILCEKGYVGKIPLKQVHTVRTTDSPATILVFRVHESGQPVRVLAK